ncbi:nucleotide exchange factor GrpE [Xylanibacter brevis]|uniref:nucleotide exchange factor GrpE n=1 Tax=Xylanibacter brevis TaxID=83231 RepID=UPI00048724A2|nr:nucleotide exchange factor GrpE [Xylanibacter brevis]
MTEKDINIEEQEQTTDQVAAEQENTENTENTEKAENADAAENAEKQDEAEQIIADLKDKYLRTMAEFDNFRKRTIKERQELILNGGKKTITALLPVIDDMERAMENGKKTDDIEVLREGMQLIYQKLMKTLEAQGVTKIETENADFDTNLHEAVALVPGMGDDKKGKVIDCMATGYKLNDEVIRYAKVAVGQ